MLGDQLMEGGTVAVRIPGSCAAARLRERTAKNLRDARLRAGLAQRQVSETSGIDIGSLSRIERGIGNPTIGTLAKLAAAVGADPADLFAATDTDAPAEETIQAIQL